MNFSVPTSVQTPSRQQLSAIVLTIAVLVSMLAAPVVSVASAQAATGTNATNTTSSGGAKNTSTGSGPQVGRLKPANTTNGTSGNTTTVAEFAQRLVSMSSEQANQAIEDNPKKADRLSDALKEMGYAYAELDRASFVKDAAKFYLKHTETPDKGGGSGVGSNMTNSMVKWVKKLAEMSPKQAKKAVDNNPQRAKNLRKALKRFGVNNPKKMVQNNPREAARKVASLLALGGGSGGSGGSGGGGGGDGGKQIKLRQCSGGFIESAICKVTNFLFGWIIGGIVSFVQGVITGIVNMIFGFSVPKVNGHIALFQKPTNQPWTGLYESWKTEAMPLGILIWVLMVLGVLFTQVFTSDPSTALKVRELKSRSWKVLLGILGSWAIGAAFLWVTNGIILTIAPNGDDIASNLAVFGGSVGAAAAAALLVWFFEGILFLFIVLLLLAQKAMVFIMMWSLPILIPFAAIDVGPVKYISKPARGIIDMFVPFIMMTLPMALVLRVGYEVVNALNSSPISQLAMWGSGANVALILGFWIAAAVSPLFVFNQTGKVKGMAAGLLGASVASNSGGLKDKVQDAKNHVTSNGQLNEKTDINPDSDMSEYGGALPGGGNDKPSMLEAGTQNLPDQADTESTSLAGPGGDEQSPRAWASDSTTPETGETGDPELPPGQPLSAGDGSSASAGVGSTTSTSGRQTTGPWDNPVVSRGDVTEVNHPSDLPDETTYQVGQVKDDGEFQPVADRADLSRTALLDKGIYNKLNTGSRKYSDEKLLLQSEDDGTFYDMDSMSYREQSYEQMSKDTSEDVLNS